MFYKILHKILLLFIFAVTISLGGCKKEEFIPPITPEEKPQYTLFMYLPWSSNLTSYFLTNIQDIESAFLRKGSPNQRLIVFFSSSPQKAQMYEVKIVDDACVHVTLKDYDNPRFTTEDGLYEILCDVKRYAQSSHYSMIIGCHGMGWLPVNESRVIPDGSFKPHYLYDDGPMTRYFGGLTSQYQTDISTLANSIRYSGIHMDFILFDDCYMSSVEVAYQLKDVTNYIIACPTEIMAFGMPYARIGQYLFDEPDYKSVCEEFYRFYCQYTYPWGTIGVTNCRELERMADIMWEIYLRYGYKLEDVEAVQRMDGYEPIIFFDFRDYVLNLCEDSALASEFLLQLDRMVPYQSHTEKFYSAAGGPLMINEYCGITTSAPSLNPRAADWRNTLWFKSTHKFGSLGAEEEPED